jgi:2-polyprenyl-6-methoxyphenol hydroxylase-like FAD-dependent oxidoreductase
VHVFERDAEFDSRHHGNSLTIQRDTVDLLHRHANVSVAEFVALSAPIVIKWYLDGRSNRTLHLERFDSGEDGALVIERHALRRLLLAAALDRGAIVHWGAPMSALDVRAKLRRASCCVFACDGVNSPLRAALLPDAPPLRHFVAPHSPALGGPLADFSHVQVLDGESRLFCKPQSARGDIKWQRECAPLASADDALRVARQYVAQHWQVPWAPLLIESTRAENVSIHVSRPVDGAVARRAKRRDVCGRRGTPDVALLGSRRKHGDAHGGDSDRAGPRRVPRRARGARRHCGGGSDAIARTHRV